jgi:hypothetical protein
MTASTELRWQRLALARSESPLRLNRFRPISCVRLITAIAGARRFAAERCINSRPSGCDPMGHGCEF